jgi:hypothetical protein
MGDLLEDIHAQPFPEFHHALLMAGWAEMTALAGKSQQMFMAAVLAFDAGKAVMRVAAIKITIDHLFDIGPPESVLPGEMIVIDPDKGLEIILDAAVIIRPMRVSWAINSDGKRHDLSPSRRSCRHNVERSFYLSRRKSDAEGDGEHETKPS